MSKQKKYTKLRDLLKQDGMFEYRTASFNQSLLLRLNSEKKI